MSEEQAEEVTTGLQSVLSDVRMAVEDWPKLMDRAHEIAATLPQTVGAEDIPDLDQAVELLNWMADGRFTFLGYRDYELVTEHGED
ncbi:hypothetical protein, partial [Arthrobacter sp. JCM 19049]